MLNAIEIIEDRRAGKSCRQIAEERGVPEYSIWNLMRKTGYAGKFRAESKPYKKREPHYTVPEVTVAELIAWLVAEHDEIIIERGLNGGYVVTAGDTTSSEQRDVQSALRQARRNDLYGRP